MSEKLTQRNKKIIFGSLICIFLIIISVTINIEIFVYENNNRSKTHFSIVRANDDTAFRTYRNLTKGERFYYEIFIYGENVSDLSIFLVTDDIYFNAPRTSLQDDWVYYDDHGITIRYHADFRTESGEIKITIEADYLVILINQEDEDLEVEFFYQTASRFYTFSKTTNNILISIAALLLPVITVYLLYIEISKKDEKSSVVQKEKQPIQP